MNTKEVGKPMATDLVRVNPLWEGKTIDGKFIPERIASVSISDEDLRRVLADHTTKLPAMPPPDLATFPTQPAP